MKRGLLALGVLVAAGLILLLLRAPSEEPVGSDEPAQVATKRAENTTPPTFTEAATNTSAEAPRALDVQQGGCRIRVVDSRGTALAGVHVGLMWQDPKAVQPYAWAVTDAEGRAFAPGPPGPYLLSAGGDRDLPAFGPVERNVVLEPGSSTEFELVLPDANSRLLIFVHDDKGAGIEGVAIEARGKSGPLPVGRAKGTTDATGRLTLAPIMAGIWTLSVNKVPDRFSLPKDRDADVGAAAEGSVDITLRSKATLNVDLSDPALAAKLAEISIANAKPARKSWPFEEPLVSWQLEPGAWTVATQWKEDCSQWAEPQTVTLAAGEVRTIVPKLVDGVASLSGRILDRRGVPVAMAGVHVNVSRPPSGSGPVAKLTEKIARSDANGVWRLVGLPAGDAFVYLELRASKQRYLADDMAPARSVELPAGPRELPEFLVDPGIALKVHLSEEWLAKAQSNDIEVEAAFGPDAADKRARRRRLSRKDDAFVFDHGAIDAYALRIVDKQGKTLATATCTVDASSAEGATVDVTPVFTP